MNKNLFSIFATVIFTSVLVGCGGGGGSSPAAPTTVTVTCPNGSSQTAATADLAKAQCAAPVMLSILPVNGTTAVHVDTFVSLDVTTDSTLDASSIATANVTLKAGLNAIAGTASAVGTKAFKFTPSGKLNYGQAYTFSASVKDSLGRTLLVNSTFTTASISCVSPQIPNNAGDACIAPVTIACPNGSSQTAATADLAKAQCAAPLMLSISPANGATAVSVDTFNGVNVVTDSTLDASSITTANITLKAGANAVAGSASPVGTFAFKFLPTAKLNYGQAYTFTAAVKDSLGRTLQVSSTLTTSSLSCVPPQVPNSTGDGCISPPTVSVTLSQAKAAVGWSVTLTWSSTNATSCTGLDSMTAGLQPTSGSMTITPTVGGRFTYTISCDGTGGTVKNGALLVVPIPVMRSSYENKMMAGEKLGPVPHPPTQVLTPPPKEERITAGIAMGDFFQEGVLSAVVFSNQEDGTIPSWTPGKVYFFKFINGQWVQNTSKLLSDSTGCISPRKILVADFNGDGKPDVFVSCTGHDAVVDGKLPGEHPRFLLSQPDGTYKNVESSLICYCHSATAADFKGDGYADLIVQDNANDGLIYLTNNRDGTFLKDRSQLPSSAMNYGNNYAHGIWTVELMDIRNTGRYDLFLGGVDLINCNCGWSWTSKIYYNEQNRWTDNSVVILPSVPGKVEVYDVMARAGNIYQFRPDWGGDRSGSVVNNSMAFQKVDVNTLQSSIIYEHSGAFSDGYTTAIDWFIYHDGKIKNFYTYPDIQVSP